VDAACLLTVPYEQLQAWEASIGSWSIRARDRNFDFLGDQSEEMQIELCSRINTVDWEGTMGSIRSVLPSDTRKFSVMKAPLGTAASVEFKQEAVFVVDLSVRDKKDKVPPHEILYGSVISWQTGDGKWSFADDRGRKWQFMSDQVEDMHLTMMSRFHGHTSLSGTLIRGPATEHNAIPRSRLETLYGPLELVEAATPDLVKSPKKQKKAREKSPLRRESSVPSFRALMQPLGTAVLLRCGDAGLVVTARSDPDKTLKEFGYGEMQAHESSEELWSFRARDRDFAFVSEDASSIQEAVLKAREAFFTAQNKPIETPPPEYRPQPEQSIALDTATSPEASQGAPQSPYSTESPSSTGSPQKEGSQKGDGAGATNPSEESQTFKGSVVGVAGSSEEVTVHVGGGMLTVTQGSSGAPIHQVSCGEVRAWEATEAQIRLPVGDGGLVVHSAESMRLSLLLESQGGAAAVSRAVQGANAVVRSEKRRVEMMQLKLGAPTAVEFLEDKVLVMENTKLPLKYDAITSFWYRKADGIFGLRAEDVSREFLTDELDIVVGEMCDRVKVVAVSALAS